MAAIDDRDRAGFFVSHAFPEQSVDLGEVRLNYATAGVAERPALLLVPGQTESWWGYEQAMEAIGEDFHVHAIDLRGQGRSTQTPGRYTLDNMGNDLVRFIDVVIGRPTIVSGNSSGGVLAAWLAAYAKPGQIAAVVCEDPPFFCSEVNPACGHSIRQSLGPLFAVFNKWLGDQWSIGDWAGLQAAIPRELPPYVLQAMGAMGLAGPPDQAPPAEPPQNLREYDPEWARSFWSGQATVGCDHERMLAAAKTPMLVTHHFRRIDPASGSLMGAVSDAQVARAGELVRGAGQPFEVVDLPQMGHAMHRQDPQLFATTIRDWSASIDPSA